MAYTTADLTALQKSIAKGVTSASINGESVTFRSLQDMLTLETKIKRELGLSGGSGSRITTLNTSSGWR